MGQPYGSPPPGYGPAGYQPPQQQGYWQPPVWQPPPKRSGSGLLVGAVVVVVVLLSAVGAAVWFLSEGRTKDDAQKSTSQASTTTSQKSDLSRRSASELMMLLPDESAFPKGWQLSSKDLSSNTPGPVSTVPGAKPECGMPLSTGQTQLKPLVTRQGKGPNSNIIGVIYARESSGYDLVVATRTWAQRCPQGEYTGSQDSAHAKDALVVMPGLDTTPDPSVTVKYVVASGPDGAAAETVYLSIIRVRGLVIEGIAEDNDSGTSPQERDQVLQSSLLRLRQAP